ncbi:hypothetical protein Tco_1376491 [Tanacetum coccineum]
MSSASSTVTYTSVYTDFEPWRFYRGSDEEPAEADYVPGHEHPPSPDYVPGPEHPPSHVYPLPADASPIALSPGYVTDSDPDKDPEEDHTDYLADGGDGDDEPSNDDDDDDDTNGEDEEASEDEEDDEEEDENLALADSSVVPIVDHVPPVGDTEAFETDESAPTPRSPQTQVPFSQICLRRARKTVKLEPPMSASMEARIAKHAAISTPPLPVSSPPLPLQSPLNTSPTDVGAPLGYRAAEIMMRALLPSTSHRTDILEAEMPPQKRACFTTPAPRFEVRESSTAGAARQPRSTLEADLRRDRVGEMGYGITNTWDEIVEAILEITPTTLERVNQRVKELATAVRQDTKEFQVRFEDAQDDRAFLRARVNTLFRDRRYHRHTAMLLDREVTYARREWTGFEDRSAAIEAHVRTLEAYVATLIT